LIIQTKTTQMRKLFFLFLLLAGASKVIKAQINWNSTNVSTTETMVNITTNVMIQVNNNRATSFLVARTYNSNIVGFPADFNANFIYKAKVLNNTKTKASIICKLF
jgi:hypothetical protein